MDIKKQFKALYFPQANGYVEWFNVELANALRLTQVKDRTINDAVYSCFAKYKS